MTRFKIFYFNKERVPIVSFIEQAYQLPAIGSNVIVYVNEIQEHGTVTDIIHIFKEGKCETIVYIDSKERIEKEKSCLGKINELEMSTRLFNSLRYYYNQKFDYKGDFGNLPITELFKINVVEMSKSRMVGTRTMHEFKQILIENSLYGTIKNPYI